MRELLRLRRDEKPIIGEVYKYGAYYVKCMPGTAGEKCETCAFNKKFCPFPCNLNTDVAERHFEWVPEEKLETAADVKFRHVEETKGDPPVIGERFIATVGLVEYVNVPNARVIDCACCDLTQRECDESSCGRGCFYQKVK